MRCASSEKRLKMILYLILVTNEQSIIIGSIVTLV